METLTPTQQVQAHKEALEHLRKHPAQARGVRRGVGARRDESLDAAFQRMGKIARLRGSTVAIVNGFDWDAYFWDQYQQEEADREYENEVIAPMRAAEERAEARYVDDDPPL